MRLAIILLNLSIAYAQPAEKPLAFEVASVKPADPSARRSPLQILPGGRLTANNTPLRAIILRAYEIKPFQLIGGPAWLDDRFAIQAQAPAGTWGDDQVRVMLQNLLAERFQLTVHRAMKDLPVYALVVAKGGIKFKESTDENAREFVSFRIGEIIATRSTIGAFCAGVSAGLIDRPVIDETNLTGSYDFRIHYDPDLPGRESNDPSIVTALQEQLGLKLEPKTRAFDMLVIDRVERPTAN